MSVIPVLADSQYCPAKPETVGTRTILRTRETLNYDR